MSSQNINKIQIHTEIENLYPDIQGQLQNRHCSLYGKLKVKFEKCYAQMTPQFFISIKGIIQILKVNATPFTLSMASENGIIMAVSRTYKNQTIFINSNYQQQQIIFSHKGQILENNSKSYLGEWAKIGFEIGLQNSLKNNLYGGIIYLESNISQDSFNYKQAHILGFVLACLVINDLTNDFEMEEIQQKIEQILQKKIPPYNSYDNNVFIVTDGLLKHNIKLVDNNWKFIVCDILLQQQQMNKLKESQKIIQIQQKLLQFFLSNALNQSLKPIMELKRQYQIQTMEQIQNFIFPHIKQNQYTIQQCSQLLNQQIQIQNPNQTFNPKKRLITATLQYNSIQKLVNNPNKFGFQNTIKSSYEILLQQNLLNQKAINLVNFCLSNQALACTVLENKYLFIIIQKSKMLKLFQLIKKKVFILNSDIQNPIQKGIHHLIFSTLPSKGAAILRPDPQTQLWFE